MTKQELKELIKEVLRETVPSSVDTSLSPDEKLYQWLSARIDQEKAMDRDIRQGLITLRDELGTQLDAAKLWRDRKKGINK
jgi:hypothetical protein